MSTQFVLNGESFSLDKGDVERALSGVAPEPVQEHGVRVGGMAYPVKQAFAVATGVRRSDFQSQTARRILASLGFEILGPPAPRSRTSPPVGTPRGHSPGLPETHPRGWPWEGQVQALFAGFLRTNGWTVTSTADTASKARGVDILANKGSRNLVAEVKGWPSIGYADPRREAETKPTQPSNQAGHWFSQAVIKAIMLLDSHPRHESLVVLPDFPRYRDLAHRTRTGRAAAGIHLVFMRPDGDATSDTWSV